MPERNHTFFSEVMTEASIPEKGILSPTIQNDQWSKIVLFAFTPGEELSEHTSSMPAVLYFLHLRRPGHARWRGCARVVRGAQGSFQGLDQANVQILQPERARGGESGTDRRR